jgi:hypothetical protein
MQSYLIIRNSKQTPAYVGLPLTLPSPRARGEGVPNGLFV